MIFFANFSYTAPEGSIVVNATSRSKTWSVGLSPFYLGPCDLYDGYVSENVENGWQFSKVFEYYSDDNGDPNLSYLPWAIEHWNSKKAVRYPMGKGVKPLYSYWAGEKLGYIEARKRIYIPLYAKAALKSEAYKQLKELYKECLDNNQTLYLQDFDVHNISSDVINYEKAIHNPNLTLGHGYVLGMLLENFDFGDLLK